MAYVLTILVLAALAGAGLLAVRYRANRARTFPMGKPLPPAEVDEAPLQWAGDSFMREVERRSGAKVSACLQCHKCSTGCPVAPEMDFLSSQAMRLVHLGERDRLLGSMAIWLCASCETCTTRCPMEIDVAGVMDTLKMMAVEDGVAPRDARGAEFNRAFLKSVGRHGRVYELGMLTAYKYRSGDLFADMDKAPKMLASGKLSLLPHRTRGAAEVREIIRKAEEVEKER